MGKISSTESTCDSINIGKVGKFHRCCGIRGGHWSQQAASECCCYTAGQLLMRDRGRRLSEPALRGIKAASVDRRLKSDPLCRRLARAADSTNGTTCCGLGGLTPLGMLGGGRKGGSSRDAGSGPRLSTGTGPEASALRRLRRSCRGPRATSSAETSTSHSVQSTLQGPCCSHCCCNRERQAAAASTSRRCESADQSLRMCWQSTRPASVCGI